MWGGLGLPQTTGLREITASVPGVVFFGLATLVTSWAALQNIINIKDCKFVTHSWHSILSPLNNLGTLLFLTFEREKNIKHLQDLS